MTNWGITGEELARLGYYQAAEIALSKSPPEPVNLFNRANCLRRLQRYDEAQELAMRAHRIGTRDEIQHLLGCLALDMNKPEEAQTWLDPIKHKHHYWRFTYALACLHGQSWEQGFHHYDARLEQHSQPLPMWEGEDLKGQTLVITAEQGLGDSIMYSRFRDLLPKPHKFLVPNVLTRILKGQSGNIGFEGWKMCPLMSIPARLGIKELPPFKPYIEPIEKFPLSRDADTRLNVGLVWKSKAGGLLRKRDEIAHGEAKSVPLAFLLPLAGIPGVKLYSLQHDGDNDIEEIGAGPLLENLGVRMHDFADLAAFMQEMDVIVSVDTGPAHLAGAMGKRGIVLLNYAGSWQWGTGDRSPWYPTLELVRQPRPGDWTSVVAEVAKKLS